MRNKDTIRALELAFQQYQMLKEDEDYKLQWHSLKELEDKCRKAKTEDEKFKLLLLLVNSSLQIKQEWGLSYPISPYLKLKKENLYKTVRPNTPLARLIEAFGIPTVPKTKKEKLLSEPRFEMEKRIKKLLCYNMRKVGKSFRWLGRNFNIDKDTAQEWVEEVRGWSKDEKEAVHSEFVTSRYLLGADIYNTTEEEEKTIFLKGKECIKVNRPKTLQFADDVDYAMTNEGLYDTGKKKKHKPSDKNNED